MYNACTLRRHVDAQVRCDKHQNRGNTEVKAFFHGEQSSIDSHGEMAKTHT
jgi:hypothetical protein